MRQVPHGLINIPLPKTVEQSNELNNAITDELTRIKKMESFLKIPELVRFLESKYAELDKRQDKELYVLVRLSKVTEYTKRILNQLAGMGGIQYSANEILNPLQVKDELKRKNNFLLNEMPEDFGVKEILIDILNQIASEDDDVL